MINVSHYFSDAFSYVRHHPFETAVNITAVAGVGLVAHGLRYQEVGTLNAGLITLTTDGIVYGGKTLLNWIRVR